MRRTSDTKTAEQNRSRQKPSLCPLPFICFHVLHSPAFLLQSKIQRLSLDCPISPVVDYRIPSAVLVNEADNISDLGWVQAILRAFRESDAVNKMVSAISFDGRKVLRKSRTQDQFLHPPIQKLRDIKLVFGRTGQLVNPAKLLWLTPCAAKHPYDLAVER